MNFALTEDQASILDGLDQLLASEAPAVAQEPVFVSYAPNLDRALSAAGYLDIAREADYGCLEAALIVERIARLPHAVEAAASALIAPALGLPADARPIALVNDAERAARFLPVAKTLIVDRGDDAVAITIDPSNVETVETLFAYPYGRLRSLDGVKQWKIGDVVTLRRRWRIALAAESAGCMAAALATVVEHVRMRRAFGRPLGAFQAIQHRLAMCSETAESTKWLALRAAWSDDDGDAAIAAGFAQMRTPQFTYDLHQFSGAMGLTLEFPLHFWTYRLRALLGELGGGSAQARAAAEAAWPDAAPELA